MPNTGRYIVCPYYLDERNKSISCEDTYRIFQDHENKNVWMSVYCEDRWHECVWAKALNETYDRIEEGDEKAMEEHEIKALKKELRYASVLLGKSEKQVERQKKKIDKLETLNKSLTEEKDRMEKKARDKHRKVRELSEELSDLKNRVLNHVQAAISIYSDRLCYVISEYMGGELHDKDVEAWAKGKQFAVVVEDLENGDKIWKAVVKEAEDGEDVSKPVPGNTEAEGSKAEEQIRQYKN